MLKKFVDNMINGSQKVTVIKILLLYNKIPSIFGVRLAKVLRPLLFEKILHPVCR